MTIRIHAQPNGDCKTCKWNKAQNETYMFCICPAVHMVNVACLLKNTMMCLTDISYAAGREARDREEGDKWKEGRNDALGC